MLYFTYLHNIPIYYYLLKNSENVAKPLSDSSALLKYYVPLINHSFTSVSVTINYLHVILKIILENKKAH